MNLVLGFGPFILFALLSRLSADLALWAAFTAAFVITIRDFDERPHLRQLDGVSLILFGALALWRGFLDQGLTLAALRTIVDLGLTAAILLSLLRKRPFSLQYAGRGSWKEADFLRVNFIISMVLARRFHGHGAGGCAGDLRRPAALYRHCRQRRRLYPVHTRYLALSGIGPALTDFARTASGTRVSRLRKDLP